MPLKPYFIFIFLAPLISTQAQTDSLRTIELVNVIIAENRLQVPFSESARSIHIITREDIGHSPAQSVNELLTYVTGVDVRQRGPGGVQADVSVRGGTFEQTLVLINGVKLSDPQTGHHQMNLPVTLDAIERIEVIKGPAARVYGQNAFAGAINIVTRVPDQPQVSTRAYGGDFQTFGGSMGLTLPGQRYRQHLSLSHDRSAGYRPNADYQVTNAFYQLCLKTKSGQFNIMGGHGWRTFGAGGFYVPESSEYEEVTTSLLSLDYQGKAGRWTFQPRVYGRRGHDDYVFLRDSPAAYRNMHTTHVAGAELNTTYRNVLGVTGLGTEVRHERIGSNGIRTRRDSTGAAINTVTVPFLGQRQRTLLGFFVEHRFLLSDRLDVTPGLYVNWYSDYGWNYFPGIDASWEVDAAWRLFANVGRSFRIPTYTDLYYDGPTNIGNDQLRPEDAITYEGGVKYFGKTVWGQASYFRRDASQLIDWVRSGEEVPWQPRNFYDVDVQGVEVGVNINFSKKEDPLFRTLSLNYTYLNADLKNTETVESRYALDILTHQLILGADHRIWRGLRHNLRARYLDRATTTLKDYFLLDSRVYHQTEQLNIYVETTNLTDTRYSEAGYVPMPGRWLRAGVSFKWKY